MPTELILIRHGVTVWNQEGRFQGALDIPLADEGHRQAARVARRMVDRPPQTQPVRSIYASDLSRAWLTAAPIAQRLGLDVTAEPALRERSYGDFQGLTGTQIASREPLAWQRWRARDVDFELPGGGESLAAVHRRVSDSLERIARRHDGESVILVTHGGVLDCAYRLASGLPLSAPREHELLNASLNVIAWDGLRFKLGRWADVEHLDEALDDR